MPAQNSLKSLAGAVLDRTIPRTLSAQYQKEPAQYPHIAQKIGNSTRANSENRKVSDLETLQIEMIRAWLFKIGEPEEDHDIVLNKCRNDPDAMTYFFKHANGENF